MNEYCILLKLSWYTDGLDGWGLITGRGKHFSLLHSVQTSYTVGSGVKRPGCEADNSLPSSAQVNYSGAIPPFSHASSCMMLS
jgi:hypothetical protein